MSPDKFSPRKPSRPHSQRRRLRHGIYILAVLATTYYVFFSGQEATQSSRNSTTLHSGPHPPELLDNLSLTTSQCEAAFPNLTWPLHDVVAQGPFTLNPKTAPVLVRIRNGRDISILHAQRKTDLSAEMLASRTASLHQIHRALLTAPSSETPIPDTLFALNFQDQPFGTAWAYSRQADPQSRPGFDDGNPNARTFLMPHFSFWAWKLPFVGSMSRAAEAIQRVESATAFASKIPKAVWRGTIWFNSVHNPRLRANLLAATKDKPWADVEALKWDTVSKDASGARTASNALAIEDFCRYKYVLHTEGVTYSGRFQFLQMCASVVITPPIGWMQHATHLVRPLFTRSLKEAGGSWTPNPMTWRSWPTEWSAEEANIVFVAPDWSDLEETIQWLEAHPKAAEGIARRQRETFVEGGYFSPAAEACYWRALVRGWSEVVRWDERELEEFGDGQTFEGFVLTNGD